MSLSVDGYWYQPEPTWSWFIWTINLQKPMKKLTIALLGLFAISSHAYAQSGVVGTILDTAQIIQDVDDMLNGDSGDYYDDGDYGYSGYGYPPASRPDYRYPPPEPGGGYDRYRHRMGYPDGPREGMDQPGMDSRGSHGGMIGRPDRNGMPDGHQGGFGSHQDGSYDGMIGRPDRQDGHHANRNGSLFGGNRGNDGHMEQNPDSQRGGISSDNSRHPENNRQGGLFGSNDRTSSHRHHEDAFGNRQNRDHHGGGHGGRH